MSSQYGEHEAILAHFLGRDPATLRFLDVGAFDGSTFSNTKPLADLGWSGVCVEPSPPAFCHLMKTYAGNDRVRLVNAALMATNFSFLPSGTPWPRLQQLHCNTADAISADMMSTFETAHRNKWAGHPFREIWIPVIGWRELGELARPAFNFVNIDVEGINAEVLVDMPLNPELVCVEADPPDEIERVLRHQYRNLKLIGGNWLAWDPK